MLLIHTVDLIKNYSTLGVHYRDLQARVHEQETRNLTLHEAQPSAVLNFEFLVRERVLVNPIMHEQSAENVLRGDFLQTRVFFWKIAQN